MTDNLLATIPGEYIARAAAGLPDPQSAPDEPHEMVITLPRPDGRGVVLSFKPFKHKRDKTTHSFWTAASGAARGMKARPDC